MRSIYRRRSKWDWPLEDVKHGFAIYVIPPYIFAYLLKRRDGRIIIKFVAWLRKTELHYDICKSINETFRDELVVVLN